jgi:hypothetical protein
LKAVLPEGRLEISPNFFKISPKLSQQQKTSIKYIKQHIKAIFSLMLDMKTFFLNTIIYLEKKFMGKFFLLSTFKIKKIAQSQISPIFSHFGNFPKG